MERKHILTSKCPLHFTKIISFRGQQRPRTNSIKPFCCNWWCRTYVHDYGVWFCVSKDIVFKQGYILVGRLPQIGDLHSVGWYEGPRALVAPVKATWVEVAPAFTHQNLVLIYGAIIYSLTVGAAIAQWIRLRLPSLGPKFIFKAQQRCFFQLKLIVYLWKG